jgi:outer membrane protein assembly factor BamB
VNNASVRFLAWLVAAPLLGVVGAVAPAEARTIRGLVYDDANHDGVPSPHEAPIPGAVVAFGVQAFAVTDATGAFALDVPDAIRAGIVWVRVPDGFRPGPVWAAYDDANHDVDLGLTRLAQPHVGPVTFVVAADTHVAWDQAYFGADELATAATAATALEPGPAFFTVVGDITQGNRDAEFDLVERALAGIDVPWVPVPGNHDWYDGGATWLRRFGPDNYSFDVGTVHVVVWNMAMSEADIRTYLGAELSRVAAGMTIVALTHAPPSAAVVDALRELGVSYVFTGHAHSNRVVDHDGVIELNTEPMLMGGLDFTPAGYRVVTLDGGRLTSSHRTVVDAPLLRLIAPSTGQCVPALGADLIVAAELGAGHATVRARLDCATPIELRYGGGWSWQTRLPALAAGAHTLTVDAHAPAGEDAHLATTIEVCEPPAPPAVDPAAAWPQVGGGPSHLGARAAELAPPLVTRWTATVGGHVLQGAPVIARGTVFVAATDLGDGVSGGVVALALADGAARWRHPLAVAVRGGPAVVAGVVVVGQIDGVVLGLDATDGRELWRYELGAGVDPAAAALYAAPAVDGSDVLVGVQRHLAVIGVGAGALRWTADPVPAGRDSESLAAVAIGDGLAVGVFNRAIGGLIAWDRLTGERLWHLDGALATAINAAPLIDGGVVYVVNGIDEVFALDAVTGAPRWKVKLDPAGFDWGHATVGTPALADGVLIVPTLYRDLVALDAATGAELWRHAGAPSAIHTTHYRGARTAGYEASPVVTGGIVWALDTSGALDALDLHTGRGLWHHDLGTPTLAGAAVAGDWLVVASYDGTVRALAPTAVERAALPAPPVCSATPPPPAPTPGDGDLSCCGVDHGPAGPLALTLLVALGLWLPRRRRPR